jgi:hypothetical protein
MNIKRIILAAVGVWLASTAFRLLTCGWLFNWIYQIQPIIWQDPANMAAPLNLILNYALGLVIAFIFVFIFAQFAKVLPAKGVRKGINYGLLVWLLGAFSGMVTMPFYMDISPVVVLYWLIQALIISVINGAIVGAIVANKK